MSEAVAYEQLDQEAQPPASAHAPAGTDGNGVPPVPSSTTAPTCAASAMS